MARDINIGYSRVVLASIMHAQENGRRFNSHGAMLSLRAPSRGQIIREMNPVVASEGGRLSHVVSGGVPIAKVTLQWRPQRPASNNATARRNKAGVVSNAADEAGVVTDDVVYDLHNEYSEGFTQTQMMKLEPDAEKYLNSVNKGLSINNKGNAMWQGLAEVGERIMEKIDNSIFDPLNLVSTTNLIAGIGRNLVDGTDGTNIPTIALFDLDGRVKNDLLHFLNDIILVHQLKSKLVIVGGRLLKKWMTGMRWTSVQDYGYNADKMMQDLPFEFFYDSNIDTNYGQDKIIISDSGAAAMEFVAEHGDVIKANKVSDTTFTRASMSMMGNDTNLTTVNFDLRIIESDEDAYPKIYVAPSLRAGIFTRPAGAIKTYGGFELMTGIWGAQLVETM